MQEIPTDIVEQASIVLRYQAHKKSSVGCTLGASVEMFLFAGCHPGCRGRLALAAARSRQQGGRPASEAGSHALQGSGLHVATSPRNIDCIVVLYRNHIQKGIRGFHCLACGPRNKWCL